MPITKEHVWPDWLGPHLPNDMLNHEVYSELILPTETLTTVTKRSGGPQSARVRHVCQACNNGWMSVLQNDAKPILIPLLQGGRISLFKNERLILARWIVMFCMVAEFMDRSGLRIGISQEARTYLKEKGSVPLGWKIWVALLHQNARPSVWIHNTLPIEDIKKKIEIITNEEGIALPNSQTTTFTIGRMLASTFSTPLPGLLRKQKMPAELVRQLSASARQQSVGLWPIA